MFLQTTTALVALALIIIGLVSHIYWCWVMSAPIAAVLGIAFFPAGIIHGWFQILI